MFCFHDEWRLARMTSGSGVQASSCGPLPGSILSRTADCLREVARLLISSIRMFNPACSHPNHPEFHLLLSIDRRTGWRIRVLTTFQGDKATTADEIV